MKLKLIFAAFCFIPAIICSLIVYLMSQMNVQHLISCSSGESGTRIPSELCSYYMLNFRVTENDLSDLRSGAGLEYILNAENENKYLIASAFISRGLSVDTVNNYSETKPTPLYASVLYNDLESVVYLLNKGANPYLKNAINNETPIDLAKRLHVKNTINDRQAIIDALNSFKI